MTCEIMFISDVNSPLDDSVTSCAFELKFLSVFASVFSLAHYLKVLILRNFTFYLFFFCCHDDLIGTYEHLISYASLSLSLIFEKTWSAVHSVIEMTAF